MPVQSPIAKKPLARSITLGCVLFIVSLCITIGLISFFSYRNALYKRYEAYITDILTYVDSHIDDDDLAECTKTLQRSEKFDELELFMDGIKEDFNIHYLYIIVPLEQDDFAHIMSVISGENYYDRYVNTEGNLYLGWISDDEYDSATVRELYDIMTGEDKIVFLHDTTDWGSDYTGALSLKTSSGEPYALLAVDVDVSEIRTLILVRTLELSAIIIVIGLLFNVMFLAWSVKNISDPIKLLEEHAVAYACKSHGQRDIRELKFNAPDIHTDNEVEELSKAVTKMTEDIQNYVMDILAAEQQVALMSALANKDALTGIRNKTAYDNEVIKLEAELKANPDMEFGIGVVDLNFLKKVNDTYGHEKGNFAIIKLCELICHTYTHSPVFRIGGDEFVIILKGRDLKECEELKKEFFTKLGEMDVDSTLMPWEKVSAALGYAFYDKMVDNEVMDVFKRADEEMYECKRGMKADRK